MTKIRTLAAVASAALLGLCLTACGSGDNSSDATAAGGSSACPTGSLTFGIEPYDDAAKLVPAYQKVAQKLGAELGCTVKLQVAEDYVSEILAMKNGQLDMAEFGPAGFVFASQEAKAVPVASFADKDGHVSTYTAGIWVKKGSSITDLEGLAGHTLALSESGSTSGDWEPRYALTTAGVEKSVKTTYAGGHTESLEALLHGKVDAAEINSQTLASATAQGTFDASRYTEIWKSDPILNDPVTVSPRLSSKARDAIKSALLSLPGSALTVGGDTSIATELDFTPPSSGPAMVAVTRAQYQPLFDLQKALGLTPKDL